MLLRHTLLYLPAQVIGPLFQLLAMIVWTHVVSDHTLGIITLVTATHELLQIGFLSWWSQYALRFFGRYESAGEEQRFYATESFVILVSMVLQSLAMVGVVLVVIAPDASPFLLAASVGYVISRTLNLYIGERARARHQIGIYSIQQIVGPSAGLLLGLFLIHLFGPMPEWPLTGYFVMQLLAAIAVLPFIGYSTRLWPIDREIFRHALHYGVPIIIGGGLGWVGLNASRFILNDMLGVAAAGLFAVGYGLGQRAAAVAAMLVTAAAFPLAVKHMEQGGSKAAMDQLVDNSALLFAILVPSIAGIYSLRVEIVHLLIAAPFQTATLAILPLSALAGSIRNLRAHFGDQVFLLHNRTRLMVVVSSIDAAVTVTLSVIFIHRWGLVGAAAATVGSACAAAAVSFVIGFTKFGLTLPVSHLLRSGIATVLMMVVLHRLPEATNFAGLAFHIAIGAGIYAAALAVFYARSLFQLWIVRAHQPLRS
ncbi:lipopolysaccharide biosynthesis protein [Afipia sp. 1NLS2]|uniref:lipopolysaccharide biosynthesis protein n=1 Tax=Afipia sp. 1NLS2 TaxID=666684 RepID=UPI0001D9F533|nr:lipopolysaccharide biosynthesis protein [Afipia sp. 1NLS2]EFI51909.1 polysaccharide biosynthesis protein [Afipia sp. 1NLS2]